MPTTWTDPEEFMTWRNCTVYHTYKNDDIQNQSSNFYTLDYTEDEDNEFDVRNLPSIPGVDSKNHKLIIQAALDAGHSAIPIPDDVELSEGHIVDAEAWLDGRSVEIYFDAVMWLKTASAEKIIELAGCGWRCDSPADQVLQDLSDKHHAIATFFAAHATANELKAPSADPVGYECAVNGASAMSFLKEYREDIYRKVKLALGEAVIVRGTVNEILTATISKTVELLVDVDSGISTESDAFVNKVDDLIKDKADEVSLFDGGHGWKLEGGDSEVSVSFEVIE
tara:strand:+ start:2524 stop:3369 length:846 start_codon:yes stop_codon:yes gene_type:complete